jgi:hypothetical protein
MGGAMVWIMTPIIRLPGRDFLPEEIASKSPVVIANQAFVDEFLPGQNPIGQTFIFIKRVTNLNPIPSRNRSLEWLPMPATTTSGSPRANHLHAARRCDHRHAQHPNRLPARFAGPLAAQGNRNSRPHVDRPRQYLLASQIDKTMISERMLALLAGFFSVVALLLAGVGLYGVVNHAAVRRTREIGIRIALGARRAAVVRLIVSGATVPVVAGIALGFAAGLGMSRYLASQLFGVHPADFWSLAAPLACMLFAAVAAILPPALRTAGADPWKL